MSMIRVSEDEFDQLYWAKDPFVVLFTASWSEQGVQAESVLSELAPNYEGRLQFVIVDVDTAPNVSENLGVRIIPTTLVLKNREKLTTITGNKPKDLIDLKLQGLL